MLPSVLRLTVSLATVIPLEAVHRRQSRKRLLLKNLFLQLVLLRLVVSYLPHTRLKFYPAYLTRKLFMTTRAPYRYKLTRNQYMLARYNYTCVFEHKLAYKIPSTQLYLLLSHLVDSFGTLNFVYGSLTSIKMSLPCHINFFS